MRIRYILVAFVVSVALAVLVSVAGASVGSPNFEQCDATNQVCFMGWYDLDPQKTYEVYLYGSNPNGITTVELAWNGQRVWAKASPMGAAILKTLVKPNKSAPFGWADGTVYVNLDLGAPGSSYGVVLQEAGPDMWGSCFSFLAGIAAGLAFSIAAVWRFA